MTNIESVRNKLIYPNGYTILPYAVIDTPLPFADFEKQDEEGNGTGEYHSISSLSQALGNLLVPKSILKMSPNPEIEGDTGDNFFIIRYGMDWDTVPQVTNFLEYSGLNNVRVNEDGTYKTAKEVDYTSFVGNEFLIVPTHMVNDIPQSIIEEEDVTP